MLQAMEADDGNDGDDGPYYPDVVGLAAETSRRRVENFDGLLLDGVVPRGMTTIQQKAIIGEC
jgi:hypothetical protein